MGNVEAIHGQDQPEPSDLIQVLVALPAAGVAQRDVVRERETQPDDLGANLRTVVVVGGTAGQFVEPGVDVVVAVGTGEARSRPRTGRGPWDPLVATSMRHSWSTDLGHRPKAFYTRDAREQRSRSE